mmetsp:Transcript_10763/g.27405  ORF Transcript_10763/g.27405 Transcript_10763/m.27405 type:complete len:189 (+) Transcript_10763:1054-1620(+)
MSTEKSQFGDDRSAEITWIAVTNGIWRSLPVGIASCSAVWYANRTSPGFRNFLGPSGKTALAITPWMIAWSFFSETGVGAALEKNLSEQDRSYVTTDRDDLPLKFKVANFFYENTLAAYFCVVLPMYGAILGHELSKPRFPGWQFSHAVIHTRVIGQACAVGSLIAIFGGREVLKKNGAPFGKKPALY